MTKKEKAISLRKDLWSFKDIAKHLDISSSTAYLWTKEVELTDQQKSSIRKTGRSKAVSNFIKHFEDKRFQYQEQGRLDAQMQDPLHLAGCMLYWGEGSKSRGTLGFTNSDPCMIKFYMRFLRESLKVCEDKIKLVVHCYTDHFTVNEIEEYWLDITGLTRSSLGKSQVNKVSKASRKTRLGKLPYGTCKIRVNSTELVQRVYGAIQEYSGIDHPQWSI